MAVRKNSKAAKIQFMIDEMVNVLKSDSNIIIAKDDTREIYFIVDKEHVVSHIADHIKTLKSKGGTRKEKKEEAIKELEKAMNIVANIEERLSDADAKAQMLRRMQISSKGKFSLNMRPVLYDTGISKRVDQYTRVASVIDLVRISDSQNNISRAYKMAYMKHMLLGDIPDGISIEVGKEIDSSFYEAIFVPSRSYSITQRPYTAVD